jgi:hypothetical protein
MISIKMSADPILAFLVQLQIERKVQSEGLSF